MKNDWMIIRSHVIVAPKVDLSAVATAEVLR